jgi:hypothetical protein
MNATTTQRHGMAALGVARVHAAYASTVKANALMANGSWSIPCFTSTDHKPRPRRPQVIPS